MATHVIPGRKKVTTHTLAAKKRKRERITMLTAYDYGTAVAIDEAGIDSILVGDSLAMVVLGYENTLSVTMEDMLHHCKAVSRGAKSALLVGDMPFMSYQVDVKEAVRNAGRFLAEAGMDAIKLEGGRDVAPTIRAIVAAGIPVMGHLGLTPQAVNVLGGYKTQGKTADTARKLIEDALILQEAGCFALVLEKVPSRVAELVSMELTIPTIGIGAGLHCDGQVLVTNDMLGIFDRFQPKFVKRYANLSEVMRDAFRNYASDVESGAFPGDEHSFPIKDEECQKLIDDLKTTPIAI